jgi:DNA-binding response OmpR family regulator
MGKRIFIADDDPAIVDVVEIILEDAGYEVSSTIYAEDLLVLTEDKVPDLFLLDIWMYGKDGRDICLHLKKSDLTKEIPVIIVSAIRDIEKIASDYGADGFLSKPFEMDDLLGLIKSHVAD